MFEQVLTYTNHVGLLSEGLDFQTHRLLGNFPQGYSHLALVDTALLFEQVPRSADQRLEQATPLDLHAADPAREFGRMR